MNSEWKRWFIRWKISQHQECIKHQTRVHERLAPSFNVKLQFKWHAVILSWHLRVWNSRRSHTDLQFIERRSWIPEQFSIKIKNCDKQKSCAIQNGGHHFISMACLTKPSERPSPVTCNWIKSDIARAFFNSSPALWSARFCVFIREEIRPRSNLRLHQIQWLLASMINEVTWHPSGSLRKVKLFAKSKASA